MSCLCDKKVNETAITAIDAWIVELGAERHLNELCVLYIELENDDKQEAAYKALKLEELQTQIAFATAEVDRLRAIYEEADALNDDALGEAAFCEHKIPLVTVRTGFVGSLNEVLELREFLNNGFTGFPTVQLNVPPKNNQAGPTLSELWWSRFVNL